MLSAYARLLGHKRLIGYLLVGAANGATLFSYIAASPDLVVNSWGFSESQFGLVFAAIAVGVVGSSQVNRQLLKHRSPDAILAWATLGAAAAGVALWLVYGLLLWSWPLIIANSITLALAATILGLKLRFG